VTITLSRRTFLVVVAVVAALVATGAFASWSVSTSGSAYSKAGSATALVLSDASASTTGDLYPGGSGALKLKVANPNSFPVRITAVSLTSGGTITSTSASCDSAGNGVSLTNQSGLTLDLAANASATVFSISGAVQMSGSSPNACQGAVFTIPVDVTATSN
jgi:predicted extracellular nuclease